MSREQEESEPKKVTISEDAGIERGRMDGLEIDLETVLKEENEFSYESDRSPFPEGTPPNALSDTFQVKTPADFY